MTARTLDGRGLAAVIQREEIGPGVVQFLDRRGRPPGLAIVLVGEDPASEVYVRNKLRTGRSLGFRADLERLPSDATMDDLLVVVERLNASAAHDGILIQSPLPRAMGPLAARRIFDAIRSDKDVDGFTPRNVGLMVQRRAALVACTPSGIMELLLREGIPIAGAHAVVIGRSEIVGTPMALLLLQHDATVTVCHSKTTDLPAVCARADILVSAIGQPALVTRAFIKPGATVIDVGINRVSDPAVAERIFPADHPRLLDFRAKGSILVGDVHPDVAAVAGALTPVPGGVGPMTIAMLMRNTLRAALARREPE